MTASIPVDIIRGWITDLQTILKGAAQESRSHADVWINKGMRHGLDQIQGRLNTWLRHQENMKTLSLSDHKFLITKDVNLSDGRYRKLEWYEGNFFLVLAWQHGKNEETGELMLEIEDTGDLSKTYLAYQGSLSYDDLAVLAREGGMGSIRNEGNRQEWVEKVWT